MKVVAIAGASTLFGSEILRSLEEHLPISELRPIGAKDETAPVEFRDDDVELFPADAKSLQGVDVLFLAGSAAQAGELAKLAFPVGVRLIIDMSGRFADEADVPLVLSTVNPAALAALPARALVAVPDAATAIAAAALAPIAAANGITRVHASTYESASGMGKPGMDELGKQIKELFNYRSGDAVLFPRSLAFNTLPRVGPFAKGGFTEAERFFSRGLTRLLGGAEAGPKVTATRSWIPAFSGLSVSMVVDLKRPLSVEDAKKLLAAHETLELVDDPAEDEFPVSGDTVGGDTVAIGRIRVDESDPSRLLLWATADNVRFGGALAAVRIAKDVMAAKSS